ncbi:MAG: hypothetical protein KJ597_00360 [Nanoarchaeota archaeon]|nr:hypothetical protein [Nanoarchaeota archaeon]MBU1622006.1 hypothetical protein [Nanoarchaeota archaeon]
MYRLFFTPTWFNGWDIIFEAIILIVALMISTYSYRIYRLNRENKYLYFAFSFILIGLGLLFKIGTSATLYFTPVRDAALTALAPVVAGPQSGLQFTHIFYRVGFFLQMVPILGAWLLLFFVSQKSRKRLTKWYEVSQIALFVYLILLISIIANFQYMVFYLTSAVLLSLTVLNYYKNYLNKGKKHNAYLVMLAFLLLLISNIFFIFVFALEGFYVLGELFLLAGFLLLLYVYRKVVRR